MLGVDDFALYGDIDIYGTLLLDATAPAIMSTRSRYSVLPPHSHQTPHPRRQCDTPDPSPRLWGW
ncbi:hypothetical protein GCM10017674_60260 [Streptomyces gardneri]|uniref:Uncharacterized protein n=1 Tax=Streptomyces gardneri TaxID=66892 RepID=A0A4Y3RHY6_9ACTN|nr:hypothetical protein SGA01_28970 [Streptomyces gardneri]GHH13229.1 hypothetical protein GCM10017674_60260 [Streptomyces gardneri]